MNSIANSMQNSWVNALLIENNAWVWPALETLHFVGMCLLFGALLVMDLRLVGWDKASAVADTAKLSRVAIIGFGINFITGVIFCFGDPHRYFVNISFHIKLVLILLAGLNFIYFKVKVEQLLTDVGPGQSVPAIARFSGAASLLLWLGVLSYGRLIPYLGTG